MWCHTIDSCPAGIQVLPAELFPSIQTKAGRNLFQWNNKQEKINSHLCGNSAIGETMGEKRCELGERTLLELTETANEYAQAMSTDKNQQQA